MSTSIGKRIPTHTLQWLQTVPLIALVERFHAVCPVTPVIAQRGGVLRGQFQAQGITRSAPAMLIAATAIEHQFVLSTCNVHDFTGCGVQVVNPFEAC